MRFIFAALNKENNTCPGGEIGRRTVFRSQRRQRCDGSNPFLGTPRKTEEISSVFFCLCQAWARIKPKREDQAEKGSSRKVVGIDKKWLFRG